MPPTIITHAQTWDDYLRQLPNAHALQSWAWGDFKSNWGWQPVRLLWANSAGLPVAAAQILRRPILKSPWGMLYVSKGPVWDYTNRELASQVAADLEDYARQNRAIFIKMDPDVPLAFSPDDSSPHPPGQWLKTLLEERGWRYSSQQIQFKNTVTINLRASAEELQAAMKPKWRYNIRLAAKKGVVVEPGGAADLPDFYRLYRLTGQRNGFLIRPQAYYLDLWRRYLQAAPPAATLLLARVDNDLAAGLMLFYFGQTAWYMYGASDNRHRNLMPNHLLQWAAIQQARTAGCQTYDMWGAPDVFDPSDSMWGVYQFKAGFGGVTRRGLGAYDYPVQALKYRLLMQALPKILSAMKKL